jgi:hypothetical protein
MSPVALNIVLLSLPKICRHGHQNYFEARAEARAVKSGSSAAQPALCSSVVDNFFFTV